MIFDLIFPKKCVGCGRVGRYVCEECRRGVLVVDQALEYRGVVRKIIKEIKYRGSFDMVFEAVDLWLGKTRMNKPQGEWVVSAVPMWEAKKRARGFNQAELLAREVARRWGFGYEELLLRKRETKSMYGLSARERKLNVRGAFGLREGALVAGRRVILIDDVLTTGSTTQECSDCLLRAKAKEVKILAISR